MPRNGHTPKRKTQVLYDRIAEVQNLAMKINGYRESVARFLKLLDLKIDGESNVLDAGCGTGIVSRAFADTGFRPKHLSALDLSKNSLKVARDEFKNSRYDGFPISFVRANVLEMPFADATFDLLLMCGVLEYTPLEDGLREAARVLRPGAPLVLLPVKPSIVGSVLELLYNFKIHPLGAVRAAAEKEFSIVGNYEFPITEPIAWSKTVFLLERK